MKYHYLFMIASVIVTMIGLVALKNYTGMAVATLPMSVSYGISVAFVVGSVVLLESVRLLYEH